MEYFNWWRFPSLLSIQYVNYLVRRSCYKWGFILFMFHWTSASQLTIFASLLMDVVILVLLNIIIFRFFQLLNCPGRVVLVDDKEDCGIVLIEGRNPAFCLFLGNVVQGASPTTRLSQFLPVGAPIQVWILFYKDIVCIYV